jgi:hypothetical protein
VVSASCVKRTASGKKQKNDGTGVKGREMGEGREPHPPRLRTLKMAAPALPVSVLS